MKYFKGYKLRLTGVDNPTESMRHSFQNAISVFLTTRGQNNFRSLGLSIVLLSYVGLLLHYITMYFLSRPTTFV